MSGAILYSGKYGRTAQYATWIGESTDLPVFSIGDADAEPADYDYLVFGSSVIVHTLSVRRWLRRRLAMLDGNPILLFTVSGAGAGPKLDGWVADSLPREFNASIEQVALRGRQVPAELTRWDRLALIIGAWKNDGPQAKKEEREGFDDMDKSSILPILAWANEQAVGSCPERLMVRDYTG